MTMIALSLVFALIGFCLLGFVGMFGGFVIGAAIGGMIGG